jgi:hypothetical protein
MYYQKFKRKDKDSLCNICRTTKTLTWDHVPPKGGISLTTVEQESIFQKLTLSEDNKQKSISQNGVKYRTICKDCNDKLGRAYDVELNNFAIKVKNIIESDNQFPNIINCKIKPKKIIKSIFGHLLSAKVEIENTTIDESLRHYYFDKENNPKMDLKIFYWLYPYQNFIVLRDVLMPAVRGNFKNFGFFSILKYYPIAYLVTELNEYQNLDELTKYKNLDTDQEVNLKINTTNLHEAFWPEVVDDGNMILGGQSINSSVFAKPKK